MNIRRSRFKCLNGEKNVVTSIYVIDDVTITIMMGSSQKI